MDSLLNFLSGKKSYIAALVSVVAGVWGYLHGTLSFSQAVQNVPGLLVYLGAGVAALRAAIAKVEAAVRTK